MPQHYKSAQNLKALTEALYQDIKTERQKLAPNQILNIVVSSQSVEQFLIDEFLARDKILMGVEFPFLENTIENFFKDEKTSKPRATLFELELAVLQYIKGPEGENFLKEINLYSDAPGGNAVAISRHLARTIREYLLHIPEQMAANGDIAFLKMWRSVRELLREKCTLPLIMDSLRIDIPIESVKSIDRVFLFSLPKLSAFHEKAITAMARYADIHVYSPEAIDSTCRTLPSIASAAIEIWAIPGKWRGAELLADYCHAELLKDKTLAQFDLTVLLNKPDEQIPAWKQAMAMRTLTFSMRSALSADKNVGLKLMQIFAQASGGVSRALLLSYLENSLVKETFGWDKEKIQSFVSALETAHGFRDDYPELQAVYNFSAAIERLKRGHFMLPRDKKLAAHERSLDNPETLAQFESGLKPLLSFSKELVTLKARKLTEKFLSQLKGFAPLDEPWFESIKSLIQTIDDYLGDTNLNMAELIAILDAHLPRETLSERKDSLGIRAENFTGIAFSARQIIVCDLNEHADLAKSAKAYLPEYEFAPSRLTSEKQLELSLYGAWAGAQDKLIIAYSSVDPKTGATLYPSAVLARFKRHLELLGVQVTERIGLAPNMLLDNGSSAADADFYIRQSLRQKPVENNVAARIYRTPHATARSVLQIADLASYLTRPTRFRLQNFEEKTVTDFDFSEPPLAIAEKNKLLFCHEYIEAIRLNNLEKAISAPLDYIKARQLAGTLPPEGFDQAQAQLKITPSSEILETFAVAERTVRRIEYILVPNLEKPFIKEDHATLMRHYLRSPVVAGKSLAGAIGPFFERDGILCLRQSQIYPQTVASLARIRLYLALLKMVDIVREIVLEEIRVTTTKKKAIAGSLVVKYAEVGRLDQEPMLQAETFLSDLIADMAKNDIFWFDAKEIKKPEKIDSLETLKEQLDAVTRGKAPFLRSYYMLNTSQRSFDFYQKFYS